MWGHVVQLTLKPGSIYLHIFSAQFLRNIFKIGKKKKIVMHESRELGEKPQRKIKYFCMSGACHVMAPTRARASLAPQTWPSSSSTGCTPSGPYPVSQSLLPHHLLPCSHDLGPGPSDPHRVGPLLERVTAGVSSALLPASPAQASALFPGLGLQSCEMGLCPFQHESVKVCFLLEGIWSAECSFCLSRRIQQTKHGHFKTFSKLQRAVKIYGKVYAKERFLEIFQVLTIMSHSRPTIGYLSNTLKPLWRILP